MPAITDTATLDVAHVLTWTADLDAWLPTVDEPELLTQTGRQIDVIEAWVKGLPGVAGLAALQASRRRLQVRIGEVSHLLGVGGTRARGISARAIAEGRKMAANKPVVERVIAESDDSSTASARKVTKAIDGERRHGGSTVDVTVRLSSEHVAILDAYCAAKGWSRAETIGKLIVRGLSSPKPAPTRVEPVSGCRHAKAVVLNGGMKRCGDCGATANTKGVWA